MTNLSRGAILQGFLEVVEDLGIDARALVHEAGLPQACLTEPDIKLSSDAAFQLLESTARRFAIADLGLRMAEKRRLSTLGAIGMAMREQPDVGHALKLMTDHIWSHAEGLSMAFEASDGLVILAPDIAHARDTNVRQATELMVAVISNLLRRFLGAGWRPEMVCFSHSRTAGLVRYQRIFGQTPLFGQERTMLVVRAEDLAAEIPGADPVAAQHLARYLEFVEGPHPVDFVTKVHDLIRLLLPRGACQIVPVAARLGISRRTLHRRLAAQDTSFDALVQQVRIELASDYLGAGNHSLTEIAALVGFAHLSGFSRWRRRWLADGGTMASPDGVATAQSLAPGAQRRQGPR